MYTQIAANKRKTILLIFLFVVLVSALGYLISLWQNSPTLFIGIFIFSVTYALISYFASAQIALKLAGAKPVTKKEAPQLYRVVENLAITSGLPMPKVYLVADPAPNAFATGRDPDHAVVAATSGLLEMLDDEELEGVIAHELSHIGNYDIRLMAVVLVLVTVVIYISDFFLRTVFWGGLGDDEDSSSNAIAGIFAIALAVLAPVIATLLQLAVSRKREYLADASGALLTRYPEGLERALRKIGAYDKSMRHANNATAHMYFSNPLKGKKRAGFMANLFSTHPPIEDRIKRLQEIGKGL